MTDTPPAPEPTNFSPYANTAEERRDASRLVLRHARNRQDLQLLLNVLGLTTSQETQ
jgi:hypothetical protein